MSEHAQAYREEGFVLVPGLVPVNLFKPVEAAIDAHVDRLATLLLAKGEIRDLRAGEPFDRRLASLFHGRDMGVRMWDEVLTREMLLSLVQSPGVAGVLEELLGPDVSFSGDFHVRPKLPESSLTSFPWHQDSQYYGAVTEAMEIVTVWIPFVDVNEDNGCLWVLPGSQHWGLLAGARGSDQNIRTFEDVEKRGTPVPVPMKRGDALFFSNLTFHASKLNVTRQVRWSLDLRYYATPDDRAMKPREAEAYAYFKGKLRSSDRVPVPVCGRGTEAASAR